MNYTIFKNKNYTFEFLINIFRIFVGLFLNLNTIKLFYKSYFYNDLFYKDKILIKNKININ